MLNGQNLLVSYIIMFFCYILLSKSVTKQYMQTFLFQLLCACIQSKLSCSHWKNLLNNLQAKFNCSIQVSKLNFDDWTGLPLATPNEVTCWITSDQRFKYLTVIYRLVNWTELLPLEDPYFLQWRILLNHLQAEIWIFNCFLHVCKLY